MALTVHRYTKLTFPIKVCSGSVTRQITPSSPHRTRKDKVVTGCLLDNSTTTDFNGQRLLCLMRTVNPIFACVVCCNRLPCVGQSWAYSQCIWITLAYPIPTLTACSTAHVGIPHVNLGFSLAFLSLFPPPPLLHWSLHSCICGGRISGFYARALHRNINIHWQVYTFGIAVVVHECLWIMHSIRNT